MNVVVDELAEQVLDASNGMKSRRERRLRTAVSRAEQLADEETDVVADAVGATRSYEKKDMREMQLAQTSRCASDEEFVSFTAPPQQALSHDR